jgi:hypothetical protein
MVQWEDRDLTEPRLVGVAPDAKVYFSIKLDCRIIPKVAFSIRRYRALRFCLSVYFDL